MLRFFADFESGKSFATEYQGSQSRGALGMRAFLRRAIENNLAITAGEFLSALTLAKCQELFAGDPPMPMLEERCTLLKEAGNVLCDSYRGSFHSPLPSLGLHLHHYRHGVRLARIQHQGTRNNITRFDAGKVFPFSGAQIGHRS